MLNAIWIALVLGAVAVAAFTGRMDEVGNGALDGAKSAITLVIGLTGGMVLFLGLARVASEGGMLRVIVRVLRPILRRLFPSVPEDHPAMGAMIMNFASNMMGLGNAATPFGIKAIVELNRLNTTPGSATNAMALFLAINTSSIVLFPPTGTVMARVEAGSAMPFAIWVPTLIATFCSTMVAVTTCLWLQNRKMFRPRPAAAAAAGAELEPEPADSVPEPDAAELGLPDLDAPRVPMGRNRAAVLLVFGIAVAIGLGARLGDQVPQVGAWGFFRDEFFVHWMLPLLIAGFVLVGIAGRVQVYDVLVESGREGLDVAVRIAPYLVAILVAIGMFRGSGALDFLIGALEPLTSAIGVPAAALPMALLRPLSGSGSFGVMAEILQTHGADSFTGLLASTLMGSTETTFYVLAVYLGAARIGDARHILLACLAGDFAGFAGAVVACHLFFG